MFEQYEHVRLENGLEGVLIEVFEDGAGYLFERDDAPYLDDDADPHLFVAPGEIAEVI